MKQFVLFSLLWVWLVPAAIAQQQVSGKVTDGGTGDGLPGVNILVKGTGSGTTTDLEGNYRLNVSGPEAVLVYSFIGYLPQEVTAGNRTVIDVALEPDMQSLDEVVVVGYGVQKKKLVTGATVQVEGDQIQRQSTTNALQGLQGQAPGVQIANTSGQPGSQMRVILRGVGTLGSTQPLYVVDGVQTGDISFLNPADIESVDVLKDAASAAIYGSQASNGVVLITTKKGKAGQRAQITFDAFYGHQNLGRKVDMLNATEYAAIMNEAAINSGRLPIFTNEQIANPGMDGLGYANTDWIDEMFVNDAVTQNYVLGATGGSETSTYSTSLAYTSTEGIVGGRDLSYYERYNFRINSEHKLYKDILKIGENLNFAYTQDNGIGVGGQYNNSLRGAFNTSPFVPMYDSEGNFWDNTNSTWNTGEANPYANMVLNNQNTNNDQRLLGNVYLQLEPVERLTFRTDLGIDYSADEGRSYTPIYNLSAYTFNRLSRINQNIGKGRSLIWNNLLTYGFDINQAHDFQVMLGTEHYQNDGSWMSGSNVNAIFNNLEGAWLDNATNNSDATTMNLRGAPWTPNRRMSYFGRLNYNYNETYLLNTTIRADGSSNFAPGNRWGYFPSVSAGWVLSNEQFLQNSDVLEFLKFRASWGQVGNQNAGAFQYLAPVTFAFTNYNFGPQEGQNTPGAYPNRLSNPGLRWETSEQTNLGLDARFFNGSVTMNFDYYIKINKDWLIQAPVLATAGAEAPWINGGDVRNEGVELLISYLGNAGDFNYNISVNGSYNKNTVGEIPTADGIIHGPRNMLYDNSGEFFRAQNGYPVGYFWGLQTAGVFQYEEDVQRHRSSEGRVIQPSARPGDVIYVDRNDDGIISDLDKTMIGDPNPDFTFGLNLNFDYKGFDLLVQANGMAGHQLVQTYRNQANQYANYTTAILDRWVGPGSSNTMPRVTTDNRNWSQFSDLYVQDGDFLRLNNVTLGYDFGRLINSEYVSQVRFYVTGQNLLTLTKYNGFDPEVGYGPDDNDPATTDAFTYGVDLGYYPRPRTLLIGANIKF